MNNIVQSSELGELFTALGKAQLELTNPTKSATGYGYKYAPLDAITNDTRTVLANHGLTIIQLPIGGGEDEIGILTQLNHKSNQFYGAVAFYKVTEKKGQEWSQSCGTAFTYFRRYAVQQLLYLAAEEDSDGSRAKAPTPTPAPAPDAKKTIKHEPATKELIIAAEKRLEDIGGWDWADASKFSPKETSAANLRRFLNLSDKDLAERIKKWEVAQ